MHGGTRHEASTSSRLRRSTRRRRGRGATSAEAGAQLQRLARKRDVARAQRRRERCARGHASSALLCKAPGCAALRPSAPRRTVRRARVARGGAQRGGQRARVSAQHGRTLDGRQRIKRQRGLVGVAVSVGVAVRRSSGARQTRAYLAQLGCRRSGGGARRRRGDLVDFGGGRQAVACRGARAA